MESRNASQGPILRVGFAVFGLLTLAMLVLTLVSERGWFAVRDRQAELEQLEQARDAIASENQAMIDEIQGLNDPRGSEVERRAREDLNLAYPDEVIMTYPSVDPPVPESD